MRNVPFGIPARRNGLALARRADRRPRILRLFSAEKFLQNHDRALNSVYRRLKFAQLCLASLVFLLQLSKPQLNLFPHIAPLANPPGFG